MTDAAPDPLAIDIRRFERADGSTVQAVTRLWLADDALACRRCHQSLCRRRPAGPFWQCLIVVPVLGDQVLIFDAGASPAREPQPRARRTKPAPAFHQRLLFDPTER